MVQPDGKNQLRRRPFDCRHSLVEPLEITWTAQRQGETEAPMPVLNTAPHVLDSPRRNANHEQFLRERFQRVLAHGQQLVHCLVGNSPR